MQTSQLVKSCFVFCLLGPIALESKGADESVNRSADTTDTSEISPARQISPTPQRQRREPNNNDRSEQEDLNPNNAEEFRSIDGTGNSLNDNLMGAALTPLRRHLEADYDDGLSTLAGQDRVSARQISNIVFSQQGSVLNTLGASDFLWQWGQFVDHDIDLTDGADPAEPAPIKVPVDDLYFYPDSDIALNRSHYDSGTGLTSPRQQVNEITAWIDASNVYGSDEERMNALREPNTARLKISEGDLLPFNTDGLSNAGGSADHLFLAGDVRANEQAGLIAMHTLFVREHNRYVAELEANAPDLSTQALFDRGRQWIGALIQIITYQEFLPALLGRDALPRYQGYNPSIDGSIMNEFSTAAFRFGHSALSPTIQRLNADGDETSDGHLPLRNAFFSPSLFAPTTSDGDDSIAPILRGLAAQTCQQIDTFVVDDVRNFLFGEPPSAGFDLVSLNIQRGRDHGLPSYTDARSQLGLSAVSSFEDITNNTDLALQLSDAYATTHDIDLWVGGLSEDPLPGSHLGETFSSIVIHQFIALRDGDRFWYTATLSRDEQRAAERTRLSDVIRRNTSIGNELADNVFRVSDSDRQPNDQTGRRGPIEN